MRILLALCCMLMASEPGFAKANDVAAQSTQMIVVTTPNWNTVQGRLQRYERAKPGEAWQPVGQAIPIVVGKNGMAWGSGLIATENLHVSADPVKREGDGRSPAGVFGLGTAFGDEPEPLAGTMLSYRSLTPSIECVDDVDSKSYNRVVDRSQTQVDWKSSEHMRDVGEAYRWGIVVNHNRIANTASAASPVRGGGSCIFLHIWRDAAHGTAGCTAMEQTEIETLLRWLDPKRNPVLVQLPVEEYAKSMKRWGLPGVVSLPKR